MASWLWPLLAVLAEPATAGDDNPSIDWYGCPGSRQGRAQIEQFLGQSLQDTRSAVRASVDVRQRGDEWSLELTLEADDTTGHTRLTAERCEVVAGIAALKIAMAIDPAAVLERVAAVDEPEQQLPTSPDDEQPPEREPASPLPQTEVRAARPPVAEPVPPRRRVRGAFRAGAMIGSSDLPRFGVALAGAASLLLGPARIELTASHHFERIVELSERPGSGAAVRLWTLGARGCGVPSVRSVEFPLCAGMEAGVQRGRGVGLPVVRTTRQPWVAATGAAAVAWRMADSVALWAEAGLVVPLRRTAYATDDFGILYRTPAAGGRGAFGIELRFP